MNNEEQSSQSRKSCFAIVEDLRPKLAEEGLTDGHFWEYIMHHYGVKSRKEFGRVVWTQIATRLSMAKTNPDIFDKLVRAVWRHTLTLPHRLNQLHLVE